MKAERAADTIGMMRIISPKQKREYEHETSRIKDMFSGDDTLRTRELVNAPSGLRCTLFYFDGMVNGELMSMHVVHPIESAQVTGIDAVEFERKVISANELETVKDDTDLVERIEYGECIIVLEGSAQKLSADVKKFDSRSPDEPDLDKVLMGPREGFTEVLLQNVSLIRRRLVTKELCVKDVTMGRRTKTKVSLVYLNGVANERVLKEVQRRIEKIDIDGVLDTNYISELIRDAPHSPFNTVGTTERPDTTASKLLEGRIAIITDGSPKVLTVPFLCVEAFQAAEDYYIGYGYATMNRWIRALSFLATTTVAALYLALVAYHNEMIPTRLLLSISAARQAVPFPTIVELMLMLTVFEILRETGSRMSANGGQAFSIVGALVLGQAAVEARIASAPVIIIIALTGITNIMVPKLTYTVAVIRLINIALAAVLGMYGFALGVIVTLTHAASIRSFGVPYMYDMRAGVNSGSQDTLTRSAWWRMIKRPHYMTDNIKRQTREKGR